MMSKPLVQTADDYEVETRFLCSPRLLRQGFQCSLGFLQCALKNTGGVPRRRSVFIQKQLNPGQVAPSELRA